MQAEARPQKRMRLGTKSCGECRRRKVRCIYLPGSITCKECVLHEAQCTAQTPQQSHHMTDSSDDGTSMRQRLEELEGMVRYLCKAVDPNIDVSKAGKFEAAAGAVQLLRQSSTPSDYSSPQTAIDASISTSVKEAGNLVESLDDAPLLNLFKAAMLLDRKEVYGDISQLSLNAQSRIQACIKPLNALIPSFEDLTSILEGAHTYWPLWNAFPKDVLPESGYLPVDGIASVRSFILDSLRSGDGISVARAVLCLALCIQQLPARFSHDIANFPASLSSLLDSYMTGAETLLSASGSSAGSVDGLACFGLLTRLYINMGKPRNAWLCLRNAMSYALLRGLHNLDESADERLQTIWSHIWQYDRQLSLILGLPTAIPTTHPGVMRPPTHQLAKDGAGFELSVIAGQIIERNQNHKLFSYSSTERIEKELLKYRNGPAANLLDSSPTPFMPLQTIYGLQTAKIYFNSLRKALHLPYMLNSSTNKAYEYSRLIALDSAREITKAWQELRECSGQETLIICDLLDFQVFTAAIVLAINLLSPHCSDDIGRQARDWELVQETSRSLRRVSEVMECNVAGQAALLLEHLYTAYHGAYDAPETYEATIPYFGKVRISQVKRKPPSLAISALNENKEHGQCLYSNTVAFSADSFVPFSQNYMGDYLTEAELGVDWTAIFNDDVNYDWSQSFDSSSFGMGLK